jgi:hypothetical protein
LVVEHPASTASSEPASISALRRSDIEAEVAADPPPRKSCLVASWKGMFSESRPTSSNCPELARFTKSELLSLVIPLIQMHFSSKPNQQAQAAHFL